MDPFNGRFTTPDPVGPWGDPGNFGNPYTYTGNNPWSRTDPYGLDTYNPWTDIREVWQYYVRGETLGGTNVLPSRTAANSGNSDDVTDGTFGRTLPDSTNSAYSAETGQQLGQAFNDTLNDARNAAMMGGSMLSDVGPVLEGINAIVDSSQGNYYQAATNIAIAGIASGLGGKKPCPGQYRSFTSNNFRENLIRLTGTNPGSATHAHHVFPIKYEEYFSRPDININIHDPIYGSWFAQGSHLGTATQYNNLWWDFLQGSPSRNDIFNFARQLSREYNFALNF